MSELIPKMLRPFLFHGLNLNSSGGSQASGDCPFCIREGRFYVSLETGKWDCKKCSRSGNSRTFLRQLWEESDKRTIDYGPLVKDRKLMSDEVLMRWGVVKSISSSDWLVPGYSADGKLCQLYRYSTDRRSGKRVLLATPGEGHQLHGLGVCDKPEIWVCYSADTEVLTDRGWYLFSNLKNDDKLAAYNPLDESIDFEVPKQRQVLRYQGPMINFHCRWSDLLVTPDHRMLYRWPHNRKVKVKAAVSIGRAIQLPVSGYYHRSGSGPTEWEARLLVAFVADGCIRRGFQLEFTLTKDRKNARLKMLLRKAGVDFQINQYQSNQGSESILVDHRSSEFFLRYCPEKTWTGSELNWPLETRLALLDELKYWDGDSGIDNTRYFTSKKNEAEIISQLAVLSGYSSQLRVKLSDNQDWSDEFVLSLMDKRWRELAIKPTKVPYDGNVYCATVSTGFLVVRRNGKSIISGNCEGPWDGMALWEVLRSTKEDKAGNLVATVNESISLLNMVSIVAVPGCGAVGEPLEKFLTLFADKSVVLAFDSDHGRHIDGRAIPPVGFSATRRAASIISKANPSMMRYLNWGPNGFDADKPSGYDVRDMLSEAGPELNIRIKAVDKLFKMIKPVPDDWLVSKKTSVFTGGRTGSGVGMECKGCSRWDELTLAWRKAMKWTDGMDRALSVMLACVTSTKALGDQLWIKIISPPGGGKSTLCEALSINKRYIYSKSTIRGFHSGHKSDKQGTEDHGLIPKIRDKTLVTKDGDTLLQSPNLGQILSEARDLYDGTARVHYRHGIDRDSDGVRMTWILCGTSSLRQLDSSELGERFLDCVIMDSIDDDMEDEVLWRVVNRTERNLAFEADGKAETQYDLELVKAMQLTGGYVSFLRDNAADLLVQVESSESVKRACVHFGKFVAYMRARPSKKQDESAEREFASRLVGQHMRLAKCLAVVLNKRSIDGEVLSRVKAVALDTSRGRTIETVKLLRKAGSDGSMTRSLAILSGDSEDKERTYLRFLRRIGVIESYQLQSGAMKGTLRWRLTNNMRKLCEEVLG